MAGESEEVTKQLAALTRQVEELKRRLNASEAVNEADAMRPLPPKAHEGQSGALWWPRRQVSKPVRALVLDALTDFQWPAYSRQLALYCHACIGRHVPSGRFGVLVKDEISSYWSRRARPRTVWLCFGLTHDRHEAIRRLWARSDWPLEMRIVGPLTGRVQHLKITRRLCELADKAKDVAADPEMLKTLAADHAADLPGVDVKPRQFDFHLWREAAERWLARLEPEDAAIRQASAERLSRRSEQFQLFGLPDVIDGGQESKRPASGDR